jgi:hypothetical protein
MPVDLLRSKRATEFLRIALREGALPTGEIESQARAANLFNGTPIGTDKAFRLARQKIGISRNNGTIYRGNNGRWHWKLPAPDPAIAAERKIVDPLFKRELAYRPVSKESQPALSRNPEADGSMSLGGVQ